jgi:ubiquinone/menaquinone biosynthesis C-methylase UbiE
MDVQNNSGIIDRTNSSGFMNPDRIVKEIGIRSGMTVADFGCGAGYFTIPIAKSVKNSGKVYAIDVVNSALESVLSKAKLYGLLNIETIRANVETVGGSKLSDESVDLVLLANILFQCGNYDSVLKESKRVLKDNGRIVIIDWIPKKISLGPKFDRCLSENDVKKLSIKNGLKLIREIDSGRHHYGMIFKPI